jgi:hypothetical protein
MYVMKDSGYIIDRHKRIMVFKHIIHSIVTKYGDVMPPPDHAAPTDSKSNTATGVFASLGIEKPPRNLAHKGGSFRRESQVRFQHFSAQPQAIDVAEGLQFDIRAFVRAKYCICVEWNIFYCLLLWYKKKPDRWVNL